MFIAPPRGRRPVVGLSPVDTALAAPRFNPPSGSVRAAATASWAFEPASFDFGVLMPGEAAPEPAHLRLVNTGETWLAPRFLTLASEGAFGLVSNGCRSSLAPGGSCVIEVTDVRIRLLGPHLRGRRNADHRRSLKPGKHRFWVRPIGTFPTTILGPALTYHWRVIGPPAKKRAHSGRHR
jgi:hypothetical protein